MLLKWAAELKDKFSKAPAYMAKAARDKFFKRFPIAIGRISSQTGFNWGAIGALFPPIIKEDNKTRQQTGVELQARYQFLEYFKGSLLARKCFVQLFVLTAWICNFCSKEISAKPWSEGLQLT